MQKCYNCGKEVDDNVLICPECGALVRRFTKPAQQIPEPENVPPRSAAYPGAYETPAQESRRERVWLDAAGKPHLNGALCFWLIVCAVFTAYLVVAFGCVLLVYHAQSYFIETLESFPEFSDMLKLLDVMLESVEAYYAFYVVCRKTRGTCMVFDLEAPDRLLCCRGRMRAFVHCKPPLRRQPARHFIRTRYAHHLPLFKERLAEAPAISRPSKIPAHLQ